MSWQNWLQIGVLIGLIGVTAPLLGAYMARVYRGGPAPGDRIFGPGTHDIKGGSVMMWLVLSALRTCDPKLFEDITWKLIWNSSEECYSPDFGDVCRAHFDQGTLAALIFESEGRVGKVSQMVVARKGRASYLGERSAGTQDPGATSVTMLIEAAARTLA